MSIDRRHVIACALVLASASACAEPEPEPELGATSEEIAGFVNYANPEIGLVGERASVNDLGRICTGTAIAPNVVLTAGHCVGHANYFYAIVASPFSVLRFTVRQTWRSPTEDIGLLWIRERSPWTRGIEENGPVGATAAVVGFGGNDCEPANDWAWNDGVGTKRVGFFTTVASGRINAPIICGGDSGGPVIDWGTGKIFGVVATSTGTHAGDYGTFTATNRPTVWGALQFVVYIWQSESNAGR